MARAYNIACGERIPLNRLVEELRDLLGVTTEPIYDEARAGDVLHSLADVSRARAELGFEHSMRLREGLQRPDRRPDR